MEIAIIRGAPPAEQLWGWESSKMMLLQAFEVDDLRNIVEMQNANHISPLGLWYLSIFSIGWSTRGELLIGGITLGWREIPPIGRKNLELEARKCPLTLRLYYSLIVVSWNGLQLTRRIKANELLSQYGIKKLSSAHPATHSHGLGPLSFRVTDNIRKFALYVHRVLMHHHHHRAVKLSLLDP